jgi:hypothetical protein
VELILRDAPIFALLYRREDAAAAELADVLFPESDTLRYYFDRKPSWGGNRGGWSGGTVLGRRENTNHERVLSHDGASEEFQRLLASQDRRECRIRGELIEVRGCVEAMLIAQSHEF